MIKFDSEKCLEDWVCLCLDDGHDPITDLSCVSYVRQPCFGSYGRGDILVINKISESEDFYFVDVTLIELKNTPLCSNHVSQISRYKAAIEEHMLSFEGEYKEVQVNARYALVGMATFPSPDDLCFLLQEIDWLDAYELKIGTDARISSTLVSGWSPSEKKEPSGDVETEILLMLEGPHVEIHPPKRVEFKAVKPEGESDES